MSGRYYYMQTFLEARTDPTDYQTLIQRSATDPEGPISYALTSHRSMNEILYSGQPEYLTLFQKLSRR